MMSDEMALKIAIDLMHIPSQVRRLRSEPLPSGVEMLLRIAAGEEEAASAAVASTGRSHEVVHQASTFFIEQILFAPEADSYRVLGARPQASAHELRRNVALLLRWLHPDLDPHGERSIFIGRVTAAWNDLKTPERRAAYDAMEQARREGKAYRRKRRWSRRRHGSGHHEGVDAMGFLRRALAILLDRPLVR
jgi:DnaJ domain